MKPKKAALLLEVAIVILLVSIISLFFFRGYGVFLKAASKSLDYLRLSLNIEEKMFQLYIDEDNAEISSRTYSLDDDDQKFKWGLELEETEFLDLQRGILTVGFENEGETLNSVVYLISE